MRFLLLLLSLTIAGCGGPAKPVTTLTLATTTSTRDSGLLDVLVNWGAALGMKGEVARANAKSKSSPTPAWKAPPYRPTTK